jgi:hypothetical protein
MSRDDDSDESTTEEVKEYSFVIRFLVFVFIAGPASVFAVGTYGRIGLRDAIAATERGNFSPIVILACWILGLVGTAIMVFRK